MIIRDTQFDSFKLIQRRQFVNKLTTILQENLPEYFLDLTQEEGLNLVSQLVNDARSFGLETESDVGNYVQLRLEHETFDNKNYDDDLKPIIEREDIDASMKLKLILEKFTTLE